MTDIWSFLLQTLTASGAAGLVLVVKALFRDKLSPRWQFGIWSLPALVLLLPAGWGGRYVLFNWPLWLETVKTALTGDYSLTRVLSPAPLPLGLRPPEDLWDLLYLLYLAGVLLLALGYLLSYLRLRLALRRGAAADGAQVERVAAAYGLRPCRAVALPGLPTAFVCGVFRPVLALPAGAAVDDKVILHELLHFKHHDAAWGLLLCFFRCLHWCNPLLWYCADRAGNDAEALCDQRVLERLEGEERRDYGRILLSMAGGKYARAPGTSSMANGTRNIRERVQAIARFKRYPAGMALVSVCVAVVLGLGVLPGERAQMAPVSAGLHNRWDLIQAMAAARTVRCTTAAGALDTYGKAVLGQNGIYRALCTPLEDHAALAAEMELRIHGGVAPRWESGLPAYPNAQAGYFIYNLTQDGTGAYRALMVFPLNDPPDGKAGGESLWVAAQTVRAERQDGRWVVLPLEPFRTVETSRSYNEAGALSWGCGELPPAVTYRGRAGDFTIELNDQAVYTVDNTVEIPNDLSWFLGPGASFDPVPKTDAAFDAMTRNQRVECVFTGTSEARSSITQAGFSTAPLNADGSRPELRRPGSGDSSSSGSDGSNSASRAVGPDWDGTLSSGGGSGGEPLLPPAYPPGYAADVYVNRAPAESITLYPIEGGLA